MTLLTKPDEIWVLQPTKNDLTAGAKYASITLPWTFNRMMMTTSSRGQRKRALNIAKGIVGQNMLHRALAERGIQSQVQRKSHRDEDLFDFHLPLEGTLRKLDLKTFSYYADYDDLGRKPFSSELLVANAGYPGPDWRRFFPMLVPHTQIRQDREVYCFAIASSIDFRHDIDANPIDHALTAFPYGPAMVFLSSNRLCLARETAGEGFYVECSYVAEGLLDGHELSLTVLGEWDGSLRKVQVPLGRNSRVSDIGPFSCVSSFQVGREDYDRLYYGRIEIAVCGNDFVEPLYNYRRRNVNVEPAEALQLNHGDFCNLILPSEYTMYFIGWIAKEEFLQKCRGYTGWVWPNDRIDRHQNRPWSQITENDRRTIARAGFVDCIQTRPPLLRAGWMKTTGRGGGAYCYVYPNIGKGGGVRETNLYILPQDLHIMDQLGT